MEINNKVVKIFEHIDCHRPLTVLIWKNGERAKYGEKTVIGQARGVVVGENGSRRVMINGCTFLEGKDEDGRGICRDRKSKSIPCSCLYDVDVEDVSRRGIPAKKDK